jgi:hypothetical protein
MPLCPARIVGSGLLLPFQIARELKARQQFCVGWRKAHGLVCAFSAVMGGKFPPLFDKSVMRLLLDSKAFLHCFDARIGDFGGHCPTATRSHIYFRNTISDSDDEVSAQGERKYWHKHDCKFPLLYRLWCSSLSKEPQSPVGSLAIRGIRVFVPAHFYNA